MTISSNAVTFCCLAAGVSIGSSSLFLFPSDVFRVLATAPTFQGAGGSSVPCAVWKEKQSKVRWPVLPHRQHPSLTFLCASISFWGTPRRAAPVDSHPLFFGARESFFLGSRFSVLVVGRLSSFFRSSLFVTLGLYRNRSVGRIRGNQATFDNSQRNNLRSCVWVRW